MGPRHVRAPSAILAGLRRSLPRARATQNASLRPYRIDRQGVEPSDLRSAIVRPRSRSVCAAFELPDRIAFGVATGSAPTAILDSAGDLPQNARNLAPRIALERRIIRAHRQLEHWHYPGAIRSHDDFLFAELAHHVILHREQRLEGEIGIDRLGAIAGKAREMMHFARLAQIQGQGRPRCAAPCG